MSLYPKGQREISEKVRKLTDSVVGRLVDMLLLSIYFAGEAAFSGYSGVWTADERAFKGLEEFNYQSVKRAVVRLKERNLIIEEKSKKGNKFKLTKTGFGEIKQIIPVYKEKRPWNRKVYLVTYDIPVKMNLQRNRFRRFLKSNGCAWLQDSLWVTPYNPTELVRKYIGNEVEDKLVIVSSLGKGGAIGKRSFKEIFYEIYKLGQLNEGYKKFTSIADSLEKEAMAYSYMAILKKDPQIPHELLPEDWVGDEAYRKFMKLM